MIADRLSARPAAGALLLSTALALTAAPAAAQLAGPQAWIDHVAEDLAPFYLHPDALGDAPGAFPSVRCNDGSARTAAAPCPEVSSLAARQRHVVAQSRLVYSYGVAFHMTGDRQYLELAKAGTETLFADFQDPASKLFHSDYWPESGDAVPGVAQLDIQKQGYALLGPSFLYYLTGDAALYGRIAEASSAIDARFATSGGAGPYSWNPDTGVASGRVVATLDPLNTYIHLLSRTAPGADADAFADRGHALARRLMEAHWMPGLGLADLDLDAAGTYFDYGHAAKTLWFAAMAAARSGDAELHAWAKAQAGQLFDQAFIDASGGWATALSGGVRWEDSQWWVAAELNQLMASLALDDAALRDRLAQTQAFWLAHFVDDVDGGIWSTVNGITGDPVGAQRKQYEWQSGFHTYEHALVSYLSAAEMAGEDPVLWFAREGGEDFSLAYLFDAEASEVAAVDLGGLSAQRVTYASLDYAPLAAAVPLPAPAALLGAGLLTLGALRRRRG